jgi:hypothetical protein
LTKRRCVLVQGQVPRRRLISLKERAGVKQLVYPFLWRFRPRFGMPGEGRDLGGACSSSPTHRTTLIYAANRIQRGTADPAQNGGSARVTTWSSGYPP